MKYFFNEFIEFVDNKFFENFEKQHKQLISLKKLNAQLDRPLCALVLYHYAENLPFLINI